MFVSKRLLFIILLFSFVLFSCKEETKVPVIPTVGVIHPTKKNVPIIKEYVGEIKGLYDIPIRARVDGFLEKVAFVEGSIVKKNQLLYIIDAQPYLAELAGAKSELAAAKSELVRAINELNRIQPLADINAVSKSDLDAAIATKSAAEAMVDAANANIELSKIKLGYTKILSPIRGTIGKTIAVEGEYVGKTPNPVILNTVSRTDTILMQFFISENEYLKLSRFSKRDGEVDEDRKTIELILSDGSVHVEEGLMDFIDRNIDATTGSILVQASFPNSAKLIKPGQYGRLRYTYMPVKESVIIPQRCVTEIQGKYQVLIVNSENKVESRTISVIDTYNDYYILDEGLDGSETIVYQGIQKTRPGMEVKVEEVKFESNSLKESK